jgi:L-alanine-DL-glutamate epimerase-like enolase superfamily enzyme
MAAPFDGFPPKTAPPSAIESTVERGIACVAVTREAICPQVEIMIDCHSSFDVPLRVTNQIGLFVDFVVWSPIVARYNDFDTH